GSIEIDLPEFDRVGVYTYPINEIAGNTAGMEYDTSTRYLKVVVINNPDTNSDEKFLRYVSINDGDENGNKVDGFANEFSAGTLEITKKVTGNMGDQKRYFGVTVTLEIAEGKNNIAPIFYTGGINGMKNPVEFTDETATINLQLKHDDTFTFYNIPYGTTYTVEEDSYSEQGYTTEYTYSNEDENKVICSPNSTVKIKNNKEETVEVGVNLDNLPYIVVLGLAIAGLAVFAIRKRRFN
ncbi:MAG: hypothetical protein GX974_09080, partial [Clostridiales bacterium]|nr:hypothetical protein [Clostridiales bacterium]